VNRTARSSRDRGFTLIELLVALMLGTVIITAAISFLITHMRSLEGSDIRENVVRNDRYIGALLRHDLQMAGIDIESSTEFGTVGAWPGSSGDTLFVLYVPYEPAPAPIHDIDPTQFQPPAGEGTCGERCIDVLYDMSQPTELKEGDLARLEVNGVRRLIVVNDVSVAGFALEVGFTAADTLLRQPAGLSGNLQVEVPGTFIQKLQAIMFYVDDQDRLIRANRLNMDGTPDGEIVAYCVDDFEISVVFDDGDELERPNPYDTDYSNDYDDVIAVKVRVTVRAERTDPRVNGGELLTKTSVWYVAPRNLRYEKNRI
jgi:prepilin-type N-terminal cleavage/methylation domain-containing protein